jgi:hypothetical protein
VTFLEMGGGNFLGDVLGSRFIAGNEADSRE